jgi:hypothetical protein
MKKLLLISMFAGMLPLTMVAQDDDLYFVPKKKSVERVTDNYGMPTDVYYSGSDRSIDEYNRRLKSRVEVIGGDSTLCDTISFSAEKGVYPNDSISDEDFKLTKKMSRFDDYRISDNAAFWAGYAAGRYDWAWHSPWYYTRYGWYDPWYYSRWRWYDPWYYDRYYGWYDPWYDPWYYGYGWYSGWYAPRYYGWYSGGSVGRHYANTIGAGTIRRDGGTHMGYRRSGSSSRYANGSRMSSELRNRTVSGNSRNGRVNRSSASRNYDSSNYNRGTFSGNTGSYSSSRGNGGSFSSSSSRSSGGFSGGGGGSRGGGGGGGRVGGRR